MLLTTCTTYVRFQVPTAASMKMAVFCAVALGTLVEVYRRFGALASSIIRAMSPDDGGSKNLHGAATQMTAIITYTVYYML
jgi:hypothetical protein